MSFDLDAMTLRVHRLGSLNSAATGSFESEFTEAMMVPLTSHSLTASGGMLMLPAGVHWKAPESSGEEIVIHDAAGNIVVSYTL